MTFNGSRWEFDLGAFSGSIKPCEKLMFIAVSTMKFCEILNFKLKHEK